MKDAMPNQWTRQQRDRLATVRHALVGPGQFSRLARLSPGLIGSFLVGVWTVSSALGTALNLPPFQLLELRTQTLFFLIRGPVAPPKDVVVVAIDDESLTAGSTFKERKELEALQSWPWRRQAYATAIERLMAAGAQAVALDVVLDLPSERPEDDQQLQKTLQKYAGKVTLAAAHTASISAEGGLEQLLYPNSNLQTTPQSIGLINYSKEIDGVIRRFGNRYLNAIHPKLGDSKGALIPFDEATLKAANISFIPPSDRHIFFYGGQRSFTTVSFWRLLDPQSWSLLEKQHTFQNKIVVIGATAALLQDIHLTPFGEVPGAEIHANAIATLIEHRVLSDAMPNPRWQGLLIFMALTSIGIMLSRLSKRPVSRFFYSLGIAAAWAIVGYFSFTSAGLILPVAVPVMAIALSGLSFLGTGAVGDQLEKSHLRRTFERYVPAPIVEEILHQPEDFRALLQGRKLKATVLFCDIRGFTGLSYKLPAEELIAQLNHYLNAMVSAIVETGGTVDKFIGDAVMAEFGAPVSRGEKIDAMNAIRSALQMRKALAELRLQWQREGKTPLFNGIGISHGEVIAGNIGSVQRLEYTVIGDTVNVASRVETLTKTLQTDILITESLYALVQEQIEVNFVGEYPLRGREDSPTRLYEVISLKGDSAALYQQVQKAYKQHFG